MQYLGPEEFNGTHYGTKYVDGAGIGIPIPDCKGFDDGNHTYVPEQEELDVNYGGWSYSWPRGYYKGTLLSGSIETTETCYPSDFEWQMHMNYGEDALSQGEYYGIIPYIRQGTNYYGVGYMQFVTPTAYGAKHGWGLVKLSGITTTYINAGEGINYPGNPDINMLMHLLNPTTPVKHYWFAGKRTGAGYSYTMYEKVGDKDTAVWSTPIELTGEVYFGVMRISNFDATLTKGCGKFDYIGSTPQPTGHWISDEIATLPVVDEVYVYGNLNYVVDDEYAQYPSVDWSTDGETFTSETPINTNSLIVRITCDEGPTLSTTIVEDDVSYTLEYLPKSYVSLIEIDDKIRGTEKLPETWTLSNCRECMRRRLRYDGDSSLISDSELDTFALEAQRMIIEQLRWPVEVATLAHGGLAAVNGTVLDIYTGSQHYAPPVYPQGVDLTDYNSDVEVTYLPQPDVIVLPEALWQAICALGSALKLAELDNPRREAAYRAAAQERVISFKRQLNSNALQQNTPLTDMYGYGG